ncbi:ComEC/Rec2 family competence protein [Cohnella sp. AR92]|uniref:ComEC/Rec2 family competence protein n=1 Tax=Cohnella sp. AR92 TaxID=648716 RepID=UPI000F8E6D32|nr:ComEC/Rec2 family competence protein [Cohnella sp. AR92]RUS48552.1 ComEC family DNA internalization-related competence protein [Cohnella sp. AR92]
MSRRPLVAFTACWTFGASTLSLFPERSVVLAVLGALLLLAAYALAVPSAWRVAAACAAAVSLAAGERAWADAGSRSEIARLAGPYAEDGLQAVVRGRLAEPASVDGEVVTFEFKAASIVLANGEAVGERSLGSKGAAEEGTVGREGRETDQAAEVNRSQPIPVREKLLVRVWLEEQEEQSVAASWRRGDEAEISGELKLPADAGNFGGFDYRDYLNGLGIAYTLSAEGAASVRTLPSDPPWRLLPQRWADDWRSGLGRIMDRLYEGTDRGYMKGLVLGIEDDLDPEQYADFSRLGLTHVLAISGLHVGVVVYLLLQLGALLRLPRERAQELAIAALPLYMLLTGASPSAVRACLMAMLALYMARRNRLKDGLHILSAAALAMMALEPRVVENVSFQLSFVVTAGLLLYVPVANDWLGPLIRWKSLRGGLAVSLTATVTSFPISVYYFHQFHLLSLPANLILVPFISFVVMPLGMASLALGGMWYPLGKAAAGIASWCNSLTSLAIDWTEGFNRLQTYWPQQPIGWVISAYALIGATFGLLHRLYTYKKEASGLIAAMRADAVRLGIPSGPRTDGDTLPLADIHPHPTAVEGSSASRRYRVLPLLVILWGLWIVWGMRPAFLDGEARVQFLDVGQGDSILIRSGTGKYGLVDAGGTVQFGRKEEWRLRRDPYEVGQKTLVPLLKQRGVRSLDWLALSHLDQDHIGGAAAILDAFPVRRLLINGSVKQDETVRKLFKLASDKGIPIFAIHEGMSWSWDRTASLQALYPRQGEDAAIPNVKEQNDRSIVLLLTLYGRTFLLPGDLEAQGEEELLASTESAKAVDVLKAGHHGSKSSTTEPWLRAWRPQEAIISAGRNNLYGHPHSVVLERLNSLGIRYFRTDRNGEIQYRMTPKGELSRRTKRADAEP